MSLRIPAFFVLPLALLAGCAGQLRDYIGPTTNITAPQLARFGLNPAQARCMGTQLGETLAPNQLREFARALSSVQHGYADPAHLTLRDVMWVANAMGDGAVPGAVVRADAACGISQAIDYVRRQQGAEAAAARRAEAEAAAARVPPASSWLNLGAAGSGQSIAVDASTLIREGALRTAWFRMTDPGAAAPGANAYLLVIDCAHHTINAKARERRGADGSVGERVDYPDNPLAVEGGTVMEIAFLSMCT
jgi:hypothetical protein